MLTKIEKNMYKNQKKNLTTNMEYSLSNACFGKIHLMKKMTQPMILNTEKSRKYRRNIYDTLNDIDTSKLKELSEIIEKSGQTKNN